MIWDFTSKGGFGSALPASPLLSDYPPASWLLYCVCPGITWMTCETHTYTHIAGLHPWSFWLFHETQECFLLISSHICRCCWSGRVTPEAGFHHMTFTLPLKCSDSIPPTGAGFYCTLCLILAPQTEFIPCSERPCPNIQENVVFPFPLPQCHIPWFHSPLRLLSLSEITFLWLSQG